MSVCFNNSVFYALAMLYTIQIYSTNGKYSDFLKKYSENKKEYNNVTNDNIPCRSVSVKATQLDFMDFKLKR